MQNSFVVACLCFYTVGLTSVVKVTCADTDQPHNKANSSSPSEVARLRKDVKKIKTSQSSLLQMMQTMRGTGNQALRAPFGRFLLIKQGNNCVALRLREHTRPEPAGPSAVRWQGAKFDWLLQADGSANFAKPNVQKGTEEVFEDSRLTGHTIIAVGPMRLAWSLSDWIYFPHSLDMPMSMAATEWVRPGDINVKDWTLTWITKNSNIVWGKAVNGLQLGASIKMDEQPYHLGEWAEITIFIRNITPHPITLDYTTGVSLSHAPQVVDAGGKPVRVSEPFYGFPVQPLTRTLQAGERFDLTSLWLKLGRPEPDEKGTILEIWTPGRYTLIYRYRFDRRHPGAWSGELLTGPLVVEITNGPVAPAS